MRWRPGRLCATAIHRELYVIRSMPPRTETCCPDCSSTSSTGLVHAVLEFPCVDGFDIVCRRLIGSCQIAICFGMSRPRHGFDARMTIVPAPISYARTAVSSVSVWRAIMSSSSVATI
jgi:hypothetical protein